MFVALVIIIFIRFALLAMIAYPILCLCTCLTEKSPLESIAAMITRTWNYPVYKAPLSAPNPCRISKLHSVISIIKDVNPGGLGGRAPQI